MNIKWKNKQIFILFSIIFCSSVVFANTTEQLAESGDGILDAMNNSYDAAVNSEIVVNIPEANDNIFIKNYGNYQLTDEKYIITDITWEGEGNVLFLYTPDVATEEEVIDLVNRGVLPLAKMDKILPNNIESNFTYSRNGKVLALHFVTNSDNVIYWPNQIPANGNYHIYIVALGVQNIQGKIILNSSFKPGDTIPPMNWTGSAGEIKTETGAIFRAKDFTGSKGIYSFIAGENDSKNIKFNSSLSGEYDIVFVDSENIIIQSVPAFIGEKEMVLTNLPEDEIKLIVYSHNITGILSVDFID